MQGYCKTIGESGHKETHVQVWEEGDRKEQGADEADTGFCDEVGCSGAQAVNLPRLTVLEYFNASSNEQVFPIFRCSKTGARFKAFEISINSIAFVKQIRDQRP